MAKEKFNNNLIKEYINLFKECNLQELKLELEDFKLHLKKDTPTKKQSASFKGIADMFSGIQQIQQSPASTSTPMSAGGVTEETTSSISEDSENYEKITSPIIGTFYRASAPGAEPFVKEGSDVTVDTTVCIVEAMKVMNEIKSEVTGKIAKILVKNGDAVQAGQPMFLVEKN